MAESGLLREEGVGAGLGWGEECQDPAVWTVMTGGAATHIIRQFTRPYL